MTETIALIAGSYLLASGIGFLISNDFYQKMITNQMNADPILLNLSGATHFIIGMTILTNHFSWSSVSEAAVSLVGVAAAIKGAGLIIVPRKVVQAKPIGSAGLYLSGVSFVVAGSYLLSVGLL